MKSTTGSAMMIRLPSRNARRLATKTQYDDPLGRAYDRIVRLQRKITCSILLRRKALDFNGMGHDLAARLGLNSVIKIRNKFQPAEVRD